MTRPKLLALLALGALLAIVGATAGLMLAGCKEPMGLKPEAKIAWHWAPVSQVFTLWAGQNINAGTVTVWNTADSLYVKYSMNGNWWLEETHLHVALTLDGIPHSHGGPIPGHFEFGNTWNPRVQTCTYAIPTRTGWVPGVTLYIAAHCVCVQLAANGSVIQRQTGWGGDNDYPGPNWAKYIKYTYGDPYKALNLPTDSVTMTVLKAVKQPGATCYWSVNLSDVPSGYDVWNGVWRGWCDELGVEIADNVPYRVRLWSTYDPNLPAYLQDTLWPNINYLLNHKAKGATAFEVQQAIWYLGRYQGNTGGHPYPSDLLAEQMIADALTNGKNWYPSSGDWVAVLMDTPLAVQLCFIEVDP